MYYLSRLDSTKRKEMCKAQILSNSQRSAVPRLCTLTSALWVNHYAGEIQHMVWKKERKSHQMKVTAR